MTKSPCYCAHGVLKYHIPPEQTEFLSVSQAIADRSKPGPELTRKGFHFIEATRVTHL